MSDRIGSFFQVFSKWIIRYRLVIQGTVIALLGISVLRLPELRIDNSISSWYTEGDSALKSYDHFLNTFGNDDVIVCGLWDSFSYDHPQRVSAIQSLQEGFEELQGVDYVSSYLDFPFQYLSDDVLTIRGLAISADTVLPSETIRDWMQVNPFRNRLVGKDPNFVLIYLWPDTSALPDQGRTSILNGIDSIFAVHKIDEKAYLVKGGFGVVYDGINQATITEGIQFLLLSYLVLILAMFLVSRSVFATLLALLVVTCGNIALFGFMILLGKSINLVTLALPPLIMVIGVSNFVHFILNIREKTSRKKISASSLLPIVAFVAVPITFNMLTTAGGFLSLTSSSVPITRDYGLLAAVSIAAVSTLSILAAIFFHKRLFRTQLKWDSVMPLRHIAQRAMNWSLNHHRTVILGGFILLLLAVSGIFQVQVDTSPLSFIPKEHKVRQDHKVLTQQMGDYIPMDFVVRFQEGSWKQVSNFELLHQVQKQIAADSSISGTLSVGDFALDVYQNTAGPNKVDFENQYSGMSQLKLGLISSKLWQDPFIKRLTTRKGAELRIMAAIPLTSANEIRLIQQRIEKGVEAEFGSRLSVTASGYLPLYSRIVDTVVSDQLKSFLIAFGVILGLIFLVLRSARLTLIALPSNFLPVLLVIGAMGLLQLPLDLVSVTLAATILGIIVDDSLHVLYNYKHQLSEGHSIQESTNKVARLTGAAVFGTSLILMLGYGIIALSTVPILATTGRLMVLAVFAALISDLLLLPALVRLVYGGRKRDKI